MKIQNKLARSVKVISSAAIIADFAGEVFEVDDKPDMSPEAVSCKIAGALLMFTLKRLWKGIKSNSISTFRFSFLGYRYAVRHFLECMDVWKRMDAERVRKNFELSYIDSYAMLLTAKKMQDLLQSRKTAAESGQGM